ncbi:hypothetical protein HY385_01400 [Candidatus Daviesbacteria bacterium]|nr:hypothetical protein [Candidatus Daviesbacteria bacterium]
MSLEDQVLSSTVGPIDGVWLIVKIGTILLAVFYFLFSLVVVRQISLMTETLMTEVSPLLRALSILHAGLALGVIILLIGILFG